MGIADAVLLVFRKQLAVAAVQAWCKIKGIELFPERRVFCAVPDLGEGLLLYIAEGAVGDLSPDASEPCVAIMKQRHAGRHTAVTADKRHAFLHKFAVAGFPQHRLVVEIEVEILLDHQASDAVGHFGDVHIKKRQTHRGQHTALAGAGVHIHKDGIEHFVLGLFVCRRNVGNIDLVDQILGDEIRQLRQLMHIALHCHKGDAQRQAAELVLADLIHRPEVPQDIAGMIVTAVIRFFRLGFQIVNGDPQAAETCIDDPADHVFRQQGAIGQQFHLNTGIGGNTDHLADIRMEQRFSHTAEENSLHGSGHGVDHAAELLQTQIADGLIEPCVPEAHFAVQVTFCCGLNIQLFQHGVVRPIFSISDFILTDTDWKINPSVCFKIPFFSIFLFSVFSCMIGSEVSMMVKEKIWNISLQQATDFFRGQEDVTEERSNVFQFRSCRIIMRELKPAKMGIWSGKRIHLRMEGEDADVEEMDHRFFMRFLSMG